MHVGGKLYLGTAVGNIHVYDAGGSTGTLLREHVCGSDWNSRGAGETSHEATLELKKNVGRKPIEQLDYVQDINSLAVLAGMSRFVHVPTLDRSWLCLDAVITLYPVPHYAPPTPLPKTKSAMSFAVHSAVEYEYSEPPRAASPSSDGKTAKAGGVPSVVTYLAAGCRRKIVIYSWKDGDVQDVIVRFVRMLIR